MTSSAQYLQPIFASIFPKKSLPFKSRNNNKISFRPTRQILSVSLKNDSLFVLMDIFSDLENHQGNVSSPKIKWGKNCQAFFPSFQKQIKLCKYKRLRQNFDVRSWFFSAYHVRTRLKVRIVRPLAIIKSTVKRATQPFILGSSSLSTVQKWDRIPPCCHRYPMVQTEELESGSSLFFSLLCCLSCARG